jgi:hypothetical protein
MPISPLDDTKQLLTHAPIQLGTSDDPCTVLFGLNDIDKDKPWRSIKIVPNAADLAVIKEFDEQHDDMQDVMKELDGTFFVTVKVHAKFTKCYSDDKSAADFDCSTGRDQQLKVVLRARKWSMSGQHGLSFRAALIVAVADGLSIDEVI